MNQDTPRRMALGDLTIDRRFQVRNKLDVDLVQEYADLYESGAILPPLEAMTVGGQTFLIDGWHRYTALRRIGRDEALITIATGTESDAHAMAAKANWSHGKRRASEDMVNAVAQAMLSIATMDAATFNERYVRDDATSAGPKIDGWTNADVADLAGVAPSTAWRHREAALKSISEEMDFLLQREAGAAERARQAWARQREAEERRKAEAPTEKAKAETSQPGTAAAADSTGDETSPEPAAPNMHDIYIGKSLMKGGRQMMKGIDTWRGLKEEYGEVRIRQTVLASAQLRFDLELFAKGTRLMLDEIDGMLTAATEVLNA